MKKIVLLLLIALSIINCKDETPKNYVSLSGKITNRNSDELQIRTMENDLIKTIKLESDGSFNDTLTIKKGKHVLSDGNEYAMLYIRPGDDIQITINANKFDETLTFSGKGSIESNYMVKKLLLQEEIFENPDNLYTLNKADFNTALKNQKVKFQDLLKNQKDLDIEFIQNDITDTDDLFSYLDTRYEKIQRINKLIGNVAPEFKNYENHTGGTTSLADLKGKYVYIDVWATWCKPCLAEIPALKELEKEFGDRMHFVSISVDKEDKHQAWKDMVTDKQLKGYQLYADNNWASKFVQDFGIDGIPRFILIDKEGKVVKADASRPSNPKTKELFIKLLK
jgi:thiol-disulfide isomerase/thioredoxin